MPGLSRDQGNKMVAASDIDRGSFIVDCRFDYSKQTLQQQNSF